MKNDADTERQAPATISTVEPVKNAKKEKKKMKAETKSALFMGFGVFGILLGAITVVFWPAIFMSTLKRMLVLSNTSVSFEIWRDIPLPVYMECFLWNITNVDEIIAGKATKVHVVQMGPYVYRERLQREEIVWNDNNTVTFKTKRTWFYEPERSNGSLSDIVTSINPIVPTIAYLVRNQREVVRLAADTFMRMFHEHMFISANVTSWLIDGIQDDLLDMANKIPDFPIVIPYDRFAWFYTRNGSLDYDGIFVMNTGAEDFSQLGNVEMWRNSNRTVYRDACGNVQGSTGELWRPETDQPELKLFLPDICTYMTLTKDKPVTIQNLEGMRYAANKSLFDNGWNYEERACYCEDRDRENCLPPGALNISSCRYGAPAFVSLPHFLDTDPYYPSKIEGLNASEEHRLTIALEMFTGLPLGVRAQLQINLLVRHIGAMPINNLLPDPDTLVPMFWFRQEVDLSPDYARLARLALGARDYVPVALYVLTAIGGVLLLCGIVILVKKIVKSPDTVPILSEAAQQENQ